MRFAAWMAAVVMVGSTACSSTRPTTKQLADDAVVAMGGVDRLQSVRTISMRGGVGSRFKHGQTVHVTDMESPGMLKVTHHHFDHTGGVRGLAAVGATILVDKGHEPMLRMIVEKPHTSPPDALENARKAGKAGSIEIYEGRKVLSDGKQSLELYPISGNPHVEPKVLAYAPSARALFQSDLFFPATGAPAGPEAVHLLGSIRALKLRVDTNVGGHGGVGPFDELTKAVVAVSKK